MNNNICGLYYCNRACEDLKKLKFFVDSDKKINLCCIHQNEVLEDENQPEKDSCDICGPKIHQMKIEESVLEGFAEGGW
jgi:hypothetical protein